MNPSVLQTSNLNDIYPDISKELCNKHAKLLSELRNRFTELYDDFEPEKYVIVNGVAKVVDLGDDLKVGMAMENGVTVLYGKTYLNEDIFINGNHLEEEVIFNAKGKHIEGIHQKVDQVKELISAIRKKASKGKEFYGGIIYIHSNIGEDLFASQESFMLAVFLALLQVHQETETYSSTDIINLLIQADPTLSHRTLTAIMGQYQLGKCNVQFDKNRTTVQSDNDLDLTLCDPQSDKSIKTHDSNQSIKILQPTRSFKSTTSKGTLKHKPSTEAATNSKDSIESMVESQEVSEISCVKLEMEATHKLILCKLDLSLEEQESYSAKMARTRELTKMAEQEGVGFDLLEEEAALRELTEDDCELMHYCEETRLLVQALANKRVDFCEFISQKHDLDIKYQVFAEQVVQLINQIHLEAPFLKNFCLIQGTVLLICMDRQFYPQIIRFLRRLFNDFKLSTCRFLQTHRKLQQQKQCEISEIMFTTSPSIGCAIYSPEENCWL